MLTNYKNIAAYITLKNEVWKESITEDIVSNKLKKFDSIFNYMEKNYILNSLANSHISDKLCALNLIDPTVDGKVKVYQKVMSGASSSRHGE